MEWRKRYRLWTERICEEPKLKFRLTASGPEEMS